MGLTPEQESKLNWLAQSLWQSGWMKYVAAVVVGAGAGYFAATYRTEPSGDGLASLTTEVKAVNESVAKSGKDVQRSIADLKTWIDTPTVNPDDPKPPAPTPNPSPANPVVLPAEMKADVGRMAKLSGKAVGDITWIIPPETSAVADTAVFGATVLITPVRDGAFSIGAVCLADSKISNPVWTRIIAGKGPQPPPIPPDPKPPIPPEPKPPTPPTPISEAGFRVMIIEDKEKLSALPAAQLSIRTSKVFRDYLDANCVTEPDGKTKGYRIWDHKVNAVADLKVWQDAFARPRTSLPWLIVSDGKTGYEGPLPANVDETISLLKKIKGS